MSAKDLKRLKSFKPEKIKIAGMVFETYSPTHALAEEKIAVIAAALVESMLSGDKKALLEILKGYVRSRRILGLCATSKRGERTVIETID